MKIRNCIAVKDADSWRYFDPRQINRLVVHRISFAKRLPDNPDPIPDDELSGEALIKKFYNKALGTNGRTPYHVLVTKTGVDQVLPLGVRGTHAAGYNFCSWAVAVAGNFDKHAMAPELYANLVEACVVLSTWHHGLAIVGHTDLPGASPKDPNKRCPGKYFDVMTLRQSVAAGWPTNLSQWSDEQSLAHIRAAGYLVVSQ